jgi:hypothetical protein
VGREGELPEPVSELLPQAATVVAVTASSAATAPIRSGWSRWFRTVLRPPVFVTRSLLKSRAGWPDRPPQSKAATERRGSARAGPPIEWYRDLAKYLPCFPLLPEY